MTMHFATMWNPANCCTASAAEGTSARNIAIMDTVILAVSILISLICILPACA